MQTVKSAQDLVTTREDYKKGFLDIVVEKNVRMEPYVAETRSVQVDLKAIKLVDELVKSQNLRIPLINAAGLSKKAIQNINMSQIEEEDIIKEFLDMAVRPAGDDFRNEVAIRYTLIKGDSFGGSIRNVIGSKAKLKLINAIIGKLLANEIKFRVLVRDKRKFFNYDVSSMRVAEVSALSWMNKDGKERILLFDKKSPIVGKNIDIILLSAREDDISAALSVADNYIACGELKGGIDPAGADEHFKTAMSAMERIRKSGGAKLLFIGSAIERAMAQEIVDYMNTGKLYMAANLNKEEQLSEVGNWLAIA